MKTHRHLLLLMVLITPSLLISFDLCISAEKGREIDYDWHCPPEDFGNKIIGTWTLIGAEGTNCYGGRFLPFGHTPYGRIVFDSTGNFMLLCMSSSNNLPAEPRENKTTGSLGMFGTYDVNEVEKKLNWRIAGCTFVKLLRQEQKLLIELLTDEELRISMPFAEVDGLVRLSWKRLRD